MVDERGRVRNPEATKFAVYLAAQRLFAERGYAGASLRDIAAASGISQPLIQHHFGSKEELYASVVRRTVEAYLAEFPENAWAEDRPVDLREEMTRQFHFLRGNQLFLRMVGWARLEGKHVLAEACESLRTAMIARIRFAQRSGLIRDDIDAPSLTVMLESVLFYWFENHSRNAEIFGDGPDDLKFLEHSIAMLERGFAPR